MCFSKPTKALYLLWCMCVISAVLFIIIVFFSFCSFPLNIHILCVHFIFHQNSIGSERQQLPATKFSVCYLHIICIHSYMDRGSNHMATAIQPLKCVYVYGTRRISPSIYWFSAHTQNCLFLIYEFQFFLFHYRTFAVQCSFNNSQLKHIQLHIFVYDRIALRIRFCCLYQ